MNMETSNFLRRIIMNMQKNLNPNGEKEIEQVLLRKKQREGDTAKYIEALKRNVCYFSILREWYKEQLKYFINNKKFPKVDEFTINLENQIEIAKRIVSDNTSYIFERHKSKFESYKQKNEPNISWENFLEFNYKYESTFNTVFGFIFTSIIAIYNESRNEIPDDFFNSHTQEIIEFIESQSGYFANTIIGNISIGIPKLGTNFIIGKNEAIQKTTKDTNKKELEEQLIKSAITSQGIETVKGMVLIPAGEFIMGSNSGESDEKPPHKVYLDAYYIDKYEVTFEQYDKFCEDTSRKKPDDRGWGRGNRPVINVSWNDAEAYCKWAGKRLPTEAEWEKACKAGSTGNYCYGDSESELGEYAWYGSNSDSKTHPVGEKKPNKWGLYDMHGNVWEWCSDWYGYKYYETSPNKNPQGPDSGTRRVLRGGRWHNDADNCRSAYRFRVEPGDWFYCWGFRCVRGWCSIS